MKKYFSYKYFTPKNCGGTLSIEINKNCDKLTVKSIAAVFFKRFCYDRYVYDHTFETLRKVIGALVDFAPRHETDVLFVGVSVREIIEKVISDLRYQ